MGLNTQPVAVGYVRVSTKLDEQATSPITQRELIERECAGQGWRLARFFEDRQSAFKDSAARPDYRELKAYLREQRVDYVVAADVSRMSRDLMEYLVLSREVLAPLGVELWLVRGINGPGESVELVRVIDALMAEHYSRDLSRRTKDGMDRLARGGGWGSVIPYGYRSSKRGPDGRPDEPCVLLADPEHSEVIREMFTLTAGGLSSGEIARRLNARGIPSPRGSQWAAATVLRLLRSRVYLGEVWHNGQLMDKGHAPLIERNVWDSAHARLPVARQRAGTPGEWLLPRLQSSHWLIHRSRGGSRPVNYHGSRLRRGRRAYRRDSVVRLQRVEAADEFAELLPTYLDAEAVEHAVMARLFDLAERGAAGLWAQAQAAGQEAASGEARRLGEELRQVGVQAVKLQQCLDNALEFGLRERAIDYSARLEALEAQRGRLTAELAEVKRQRQPSAAAQRGALKLVEEVNLAAELWRHGLRAELRDYLAAIVARIDLRTDGEQLYVIPYLHDLPDLHAEGCGDGIWRGTALRLITATLPLTTEGQRRWLEHQRVLGGTESA